MRHRFSEHYEDLLEGSYDCVDRIVLNAYFPMGVNEGGFRCWWRLLTGSDEHLDNAHLMRAPLDLDQLKTIFGSRKRPCRRKLQNGKYGVAVETPTYDLTVFKVYYGRLTLKIYTKGERVLRIEVIVHNTKELACGRSLPNFGKIVQLLKGRLERFLNTLHYMDVCFIADDTPEKLPSASRVGKTRVGCVDFNRPRMRAVAHAVIALATSPKGFTASQLAQRVVTLSGHRPLSHYEARHAAYDLKKLRGKKLVEKIGSSHRYPQPDQDCAL